MHQLMCEAKNIMLNQRQRICQISTQDKDLLHTRTFYFAVDECTNGVVLFSELKILGIDVLKRKDVFQQML